MTNNGGVMTGQELGEILARADAATAGPWHAERISPLSRSTWADVLELEYNETGMPLADATFIAHSRTDVPALVEAVRKRDAEIARLRALVEEAFIEGANCEVEKPHFEVENPHFWAEMVTTLWAQSDARKALDHP